MFVANANETAVHGSQSVSNSFVLKHLKKVPHSSRGAQEDENRICGLRAAMKAGSI
jgi:hypothetical protein